MHAFRKNSSIFLGKLFLITIAKNGISCPIGIIGDDRIQKQMQGYVSPESWTHGSSEQREAALTDGLKSGDVQTCSTPGT